MKTFTLGPFATNCYIPERAGSCWIVDAGFEPSPILAHVRSRSLRVEAIILTHAHADHLAGLREVVEALPGTPVLLHRAEADWPGDPAKNLSLGMGLRITAPPATRLLEGGEALTLGDEAWKVLHTPGHSPGGISLYRPGQGGREGEGGEKAGVVLAGDTLFAGSIGRMDFPGSDFETLERSIRERLYTLPETTRVYPGHGPPTTIGREKKTNPFVRE